MASMSKPKGIAPRPSNAPHGTFSRYCYELRNYGRAGVCMDCREACRVRSAERNAERKAAARAAAR